MTKGSDHPVSCSPCCTGLQQIKLKGALVTEYHVRTQQKPARKQNNPRPSLATKDRCSLCFTCSIGQDIHGQQCFCSLQGIERTAAQRNAFHLIHQLPGCINQQTGIGPLQMAAEQTQANTRVSTNNSSMHPCETVISKNAQQVMPWITTRLQLPTRGLRLTKASPAWSWSGSKAG